MRPRDEPRSTRVLFADFAVIPLSGSGTAAVEAMLVSFVPVIGKVQADRTQRFRAPLQAGNLAFAMEAHNGLSAKIVEEAGFPCIWASGLAIATSLGLRDCNEASLTQVVDIVDYMVDATSIPILMDGDTGGDFNMVRRLVRKASQRGVAAICLEDKTLPKRNSFSPGPHRRA